MLTQKDTCTHNSSTIYNSQKMYTIQVFINRRTDKDVVYIYIQWNISHKNKILPLATTQMDIENIMLAEISHTEKDKH